jgi:hypothetical protein
MRKLGEAGQQKNSRCKVPGAEVSLPCSPTAMWLERSEERVAAVLDVPGYMRI